MSEDEKDEFPDIPFLATYPPRCAKCSGILVQFISTECGPISKREPLDTHFLCVGCKKVFTPFKLYGDPYEAEEPKWKFLIEAVHNPKEDNKNGGTSEQTHKQGNADLSHQ